MCFDGMMDDDDDLEETEEKLNEVPPLPPPKITRWCGHRLFLPDQVVTASSRL